MQIFYQFIRIILVFILIICKAIVLIDTEKLALEKNNQADSRNLIGVVNRIEDGGQAVVLVEGLNKEYVILFDNYLELELRPNTWVNIHIVNGEIINLSINLKKTEKEREKVKKLVDRLRRGK